MIAFSRTGLTLIATRHAGVETGARGFLWTMGQKDQMLYGLLVLSVAVNFVARSFCSAQAFAAEKERHDLARTCDFQIRGNDTTPRPSSMLSCYQPHSKWRGTSDSPGKEMPRPSNPHSSLVLAWTFAERLRLTDQSQGEAVEAFRRSLSLNLAPFSWSCSKPVLTATSSAM